jgi:hypothetical protein
MAKKVTKATVTKADVDKYLEEYKEKRREVDPKICNQWREIAQCLERNKIYSWGELAFVYAQTYKCSMDDAMPSDHRLGTPYCRQCQDNPIFIRIKRGLYKVYQKKDKKEK